MEKDLRKKLGIDDWLELVKEDRNCNGAYISFGQYMYLLEKENQKLKDRLNTYENPEDLTLMFMYCDEKAKNKIKELQKQLEEKIVSEMKLKDELFNERKEYQGTYKDVRSEIKEYKNQQEEFIKYLEEPIKMIKEGNPINITEYTSAKLDVLEEILARYREIIGGDNK